MGWKDWGDWLKETSQLLECYYGDEQSLPIWAKILIRLEPFNEDDHTVLSVEETKKMGDWFHEILDLSDTLEVSPSTSWKDSSRDILDDIKTKGGSFTFG